MVNTGNNINWQDWQTKKAIKQNLRVLLLTNRGEYQNDFYYGVGIRKAIFEPNTPQLKDAIRESILDQTRRYMPYISVSNVTFDESDQSPNYLGIKISYFIKETTVLQTFAYYISHDTDAVL